MQTEHMKASEMFRIQFCISEKKVVFEEALQRACVGQEVRYE